MRISIDCNFDAVMTEIIPNLPPEKYLKLHLLTGPILYYPVLEVAVRAVNEFSKA